MKLSHAELETLPAKAELLALIGVGSGALLGVIKDFTLRESQIIRLLDDGVKMPEISRRLKLSIGRVHQIRQKVARKIRSAKSKLEIIENMAKTPNNRI
jgi:DNA-binding NarL/FixJ family response regulator